MIKFNSKGLIMNKVNYVKVANTINRTLRQYYKDDTFKPRVEVIESKDVDPKYCDVWSLAVNDDLWDLLQFRGLAQDLFYADETYTVGDNDLYLEPYNSWLFNLAVV